ncbi:MAG: potassium/proton antiporter [Ignavibacteriae bacterium]|nr:MAG: potassium/proton antiporter [Ignavibacteriota bacterium]
MLTNEYILLLISSLILISIALWKVSENLGLPSLVLFLFVGMLAGSDGLGKIGFDDISITQSIGIVSLIYILFSGGMDTRWKTVRPVVWSAVSLSTSGVILTTLVIGLAVHWLFHFKLIEGLLFGAIISSTDAAAVFSVLRAKGTKLKGKLAPLLELESGSNDPVAIILTVIFLEIIVTNQIEVGKLIFHLFSQFLIGAFLGILLGRAMVYLVNWIRFSYAGLYPVFVMAFAVLVYAVTVTVQGSGMLAVYIAGIVVGNNEFVQKRSLMRYFEGLAILGQIIMFLTFGLLAYPTQIIPVAGIGIIIALILIFVARPLGVFISLAFSEFRLREKIFVSWVGLRGAVPIILATFPLSANLSIGNDIFNIVFFVTITSALLQGWSIPIAAKLFKVSDEERTPVVPPLELNYDVKTKNQLLDFIIPYNSALSGKTLAQLNLPPESLITVICRNEEFLVPTGSSTLEEGDTILVLVNDENSADVKRILNMIKKKV